MSVQKDSRQPPDEPERGRRSDAELVHQVRGGDGSAFDQLVGRYGPRLLNLLAHMADSREDAEDIAQEALVAAYRNIDSFAGRSAFFTWLYRIAVNRLISRRRRRRLETTHGRRNLDENPPLDAGDDSAGRRLEEQEQVVRIRAAIARLPEERRQVLVLRDVDGLSYDQISEILEIPKGTVRSRLHRARSEVREMLEVSTDGTVSPERS